MTVLASFLAYTHVSAAFFYPPDKSVDLGADCRRRMHLICTPA